MQAFSQSTYCAIVGTAHSGTSIQQGFDSNTLVSIAACMYWLLLYLPYMCANACCIVGCP